MVVYSQSTELKYHAASLLCCVIDDAEFIGCFKDTGKRAMTGGHTHGNDMNVDLCNKRCASKVKKNIYFKAMTFSTWPSGIQFLSVH